eukprot:2431502-Rhodomonas_salina.2
MTGLASGTRAASCLRASYALTAVDLAYGAPEIDTQGLWCYGMCGTEQVYDATGCAVLSEGTAGGVRGLLKRAPPRSRAPTLPYIAPTLPFLAPTFPYTAATLPYTAATLPDIAPTLPYRAGPCRAAALPYRAATLPYRAATLPDRAATLSCGAPTRPFAPSLPYTADALRYSTPTLPARASAYTPRLFCTALSKEKQRARTRR